MKHQEVRSGSDTGIFEYTVAGDWRRELYYQISNNPESLKIHKRQIIRLHLTPSMKVSKQVAHRSGETSFTLSLMLKALHNRASQTGRCQSHK